MVVQISGKSARLAQKCYFYQEATSRKTWNFLKSNFDMNYICIAIKFETLTRLTCFIFLWKIGKMFWSCRKCEKIEVSRRLDLVETKTWLLRQSQLRYLKRNREFQQNLAEQEKCDTYIWAFFKLLLQMFNFCRADWVLSYVSTLLWKFSNIS